MRILQLPCRTAAGHLHHRVRVVSDSGAFEPTEVTFSVGQDWAHATATDPGPAVPGLLILAAKLGEDLSIEGEVPRGVLDSAGSVGDKLAEWWGWHRPTVRASTITDGVTDGTGTGLFFSIGVDSWSVLLDRLAGPVEQHPSHLLALDAEPVLPTETVEALLERTDEIGERLGIPTVRVATNIRDLLDPFTDWVFETHACVLTGAALLLRPLLGTVILSATDWAPAVRRYGSHPDLETRWSMPGFSLIHEDADRERWQRVETVAESDLALETLQVCYRTERPSNCGRCDKCLRTMTSLLLAGALDRTARFDAALTVDAVRAVPDVRDVPGAEILRHLDRHGLEADVFRQAWEEVPIRPGPDAVDDRQIPDRRPLSVDDSGVARTSAAEHLNPALAEIAGTRVDHFGSTGEPPLNVGWRAGEIGLLPSARVAPQVARMLAGVPNRDEPWCVLGPMSGDQLSLAERAQAALGPGLVVDEDSDLAREARCRLWWRSTGGLDPVATLETLLLGCVPIQVMPDASALRARLRLPAPLDDLLHPRSELARLTPRHLGKVAEALSAWLADHNQETVLRRWHGCTQPEPVCAGRNGRTT